MSSPTKWISAALSSTDSFTNHYLHLLTLLSNHYALSHRHRFSARLTCDVARILIRLEKWDPALKALDNVSAYYGGEGGWGPLSEWVQLRRSFCLYKLGEKTDYLRCLLGFLEAKSASLNDGNIVGLVTDSLRSAIFSEIKSLIHGPLSKTAVFAFVPCFHSQLTIFTPPVSLTSTSDNDKQKYRLGVPIEFSLVLTSNFPSTIEIQGVGLTVIRADDFDRYNEARGGVEGEIPEDITDATLKPCGDFAGVINPGENTITFATTPTTLGQFIFGKCM